MLESIRDYIKKFNEKKHKMKQEEDYATSQENILNEKTSFSITEAYKTARTNIIFALGGKEGCKRVILTSAEPGEGKTTTCINLAVTFAQTGAKVLLIDGDLRKPRVHRYMNIDRKNGLSDLLVGLIELRQAVKHVARFDMDCITAGQIPPNPVELLSSETMNQVLDALAEKYDYIFVDTPPVTVVTDAASMAKFVDGFIVVARQGYTIHELLEKARANLIFAEAKILGFILNDVKPLAGIGYGHYGVYGGRYRYKYKYGYRYGGYSYGDKGYRNGGAYEYKYGDEIELRDQQPRKMKQNAK